MVTDPDEAREEFIERFKYFVADMYDCDPEDVRMDDQSVNYQLVLTVMSWYEDMIDDSPPEAPDDRPEGYEMVDLTSEEDYDEHDGS